MIEIDTRPDDYQELGEGSTRGQSVFLRPQIARSDIRKEVRSSDQVFRGINPLLLSQKRVPTGQVRICLIRGVAPVAVAYRVHVVASQAYKIAVLSSQIQRQRRNRESPPNPALVIVVSVVGSRRSGRHQRAGQQNGPNRSQCHDCDLHRLLPLPGRSP
jgi:hypothetical protein